MAGGWIANVYISGLIAVSLIIPSQSYLDFNLESNKVCSIARKRELKLLEKEYSAISLKEVRYFDHWLGVHPFSCNLTVTAPWGYGIIAVIQNLDLRQNDTTNECIDYVQKKRSSPYILFKTYESSIRFCGIVNSIHDPDVTERNDESNLAKNAFVDEKGHMEVMIYIAAQRLVHPHKLDLSITFTAYRICKNGDQDGFKECKRGSGICIWEGFFHDKIVNCPFDDCFDEGGCPVISSGGKKYSSGLGTTVTIGAVVLILGLLLLFMLCLCVCRRCQVLCWSVPPPTRPQRSISQSNRVEMTAPSGHAGESARQNQPTAPPLLPLTSAASPVHEDKDLPPPYESLFPSR